MLCRLIELKLVSAAIPKPKWRIRITSIGSLVLISRIIILVKRYCFLQLQPNFHGFLHQLPFVVRFPLLVRHMNLPIHFLQQNPSVPQKPFHQFLVQSAVSFIPFSRKFRWIMIQINWERRRSITEFGRNCPRGTGTRREGNCRRCDRISVF